MHNKYLRNNLIRNSIYLNVSSQNIDNFNLLPNVIKIISNIFCNVDTGYYNLFYIVELLLQYDYSESDLITNFDFYIIYMTCIVYYSAHAYGYCVPCKTCNWITEKNNILQ